MDIQTAINNVINHIDLNREDMHSVMQTIMQGNATSAQIGGLLVALRIKGETVDEITAAAEVMRKLVAKVDVDKTNLVDTCGTGGDSSNTFNISTTSAFVVAASGARVAKHGNRSVSSKSGSADVLEAAGINIELDEEQVASCIEDVGIGFMFAPMHHSAMKHAIGPRRELGVRTLFNILGPLTNPAAAPNQVIGVFSRKWLNPLAETLKQLGSNHVLVVHSEDGMDEISISTKTFITELKNGEIKNYEISPDNFGIKKHNIAELSVYNINESLTMMKSVLDNNDNAAKAIVSINAGAAIYAAGISDSIKEGVDKALDVIESGAAKKKLEMLIQHSQSFNASWL
jgi:anthranilate phosphoribosyltransferase